MRIVDATDKQIKELLAKLFTMLGLRESGIPNKLEEAVILEFMKTEVPHRLEEISLAFTFILTGKIDHDLNLYGEPFSVKYLSAVLKAYDQYKKQEQREAILRAKNKSGEVKMTNLQRFAAISEHLKPETIAAIDRLAEKDKKPVERRKLNNDDCFQKWMKQFDRFQQKQKSDPVDKDGKVLPGRWIERYGKVLNTNTFIEHKLRQLFDSKVRSEYWATHIIRKRDGKPNKRDLRQKQHFIQGQGEYYFILTERSQPINSTSNPL